jgi:hypothetical protein
MLFSNPKKSFPKEEMQAAADAIYAAYKKL